MKKKQQRGPKSEVLDCPCEEKRPHIRIFIPKGPVTSGLFSKKAAGIVISAILGQGCIDQATADRLSRQVESKNLPEEFPQHDLVIERQMLALRSSLN